MIGKGFLLWTERPVLLKRELETHAWMEANRPWEAFGLTLLHENKPGDWREYSRAFHEAWRMAGEAGTGFLNVESDVVPTLEAFRAVLECPQMICLVPYETFTSPEPEEREKGDGPRNWGALIETKVPGGWDAHLARGGEEWAVGGDLGFIKFGPGACARPLPEQTKLTANNGLLNDLVLDLYRPTDPKATRGNIHLHWPGLRQNHRHWDQGDRDHWPEPLWPELDKSHEEFLDPSLRASPARPPSPA